MSFAVIAETEAGTILTETENMIFPEAKRFTIVNIPDDKVARIRSGDADITFDQFLSYDLEEALSRVNNSKCMHSIRIGNFIDRYCRRGKGYFILTKTLYFEYTRWCQVNTLSVITQRKFSRILRQDYGFDVRQTTVRGVLGNYVFGVDMP